MISNYSMSNTFLPGDQNLEPKTLDSMPSVWSSRGRRDTEKIVMAEVITNDDGVKTKRVHMASIFRINISRYEFVTASKSGVLSCLIVDILFFIV